MMNWRMRIAFGIFVGFCANLALQDIGKIVWRLEFGSAFLPVVPLIFGIGFCPESPRWYSKKGRYHDAYAPLVKLGIPHCKLASYTARLGYRFIHLFHNAQLQTEADILVK